MADILADGIACLSHFVKQDSDRYPGKQGRIPYDLWAIKELPASRVGS
jgi:hypothetical protein